MRQLRLWQVLVSTLVVVIGIWFMIPSQSLAKFPERPITIIVPVGAGGATDGTARITAKHLSKAWGVPVNVVNKPGGVTVMATIELHNSKPDGYTVMMDSADSIGVPYITSNLPFKVQDRTWMNMIAYQPALVSVSTNSPFTNLSDIVAAIKKDPSRIRISSQGGSSTPDVVGRLIAKVFGIDYKKFSLVVGKSGGDVAILIAQGSVDVGISGLPPVKPLLEAKKIRPMAVVGNAGKRLEDMPTVPAFEEMGYPSISYRWFVGLSGPPELPQAMVDIWNDAMKKLVLEDTEYKADIRKLGLYPQWKNRQEIVEHVKEQLELYSTIY